MMQSPSFRSHTHTGATSMLMVSSMSSAHLGWLKVRLTGYMGIFVSMRGSTKRIRYILMAY